MKQYYYQQGRYNKLLIKNIKEKTNNLTITKADKGYFVVILYKKDNQETFKKMFTENNLEIISKITIKS